VDISGAGSSIVRQEESGLDDLTQRTGHNGGEDGNDNIETVHKDTRTMEDDQEPVRYKTCKIVL